MMDLLAFVFYEYLVGNTKIIHSLMVTGSYCVGGANNTAKDNHDEKENSSKGV